MSHKAGDIRCWHDLMVYAIILAYRNCFTYKEFVFALSIFTKYIQGQMSSERENNFIPVKSAVRTMDILELLAEYSDGMPLKSICQKLDIPLSSMYNLVMTLQERGYLLRDERSGFYQLGSKISQLQVSYLANTNLLQLAQPVMQRLMDKTGETSSLAILQGTRVMYVHKLLGEGSQQLIGPGGTYRYAHANAGGKVLLAQLTDSEIDNLFVDDYLPRLTPNTISCRSELKLALIEIQKQGVAYEDEEAVAGVWAVASCIFDRDGYTVAAISIVAPTERLGEKNYSNWDDLVKTAAIEISMKLGFRSTV
jgi:DNA-binding IclR family transcriptional regulator